MKIKTTIVESLPHRFKVSYTNDTVPLVCMIKSLEGEEGAFWFTPSGARALAQELIECADAAESDQEIDVV